MPPPETLLDRTAERASRWLAERSSRQSRLGRVGDAALARYGTVAAAPAAALTAPVAAPLEAPAAPFPSSVSTAERVVGNDEGVGVVFDQESGPESVAAPPAAPEALPLTPSASTADAEGVTNAVVEADGVITLPADPGACAAAISAHRFAPGTASAAVLVAPDPLLVAVAVPVAAAVNGPVLLANDPATPAELARLAPATLYALGADVEGADRIDPQQPHDPAAASIAAAEFVRHRTGTVRAFCIGATEQARGIAGPVAAAAAARRYPLMVGCDAARQGAMEGERRAAVTYLVGRDAIAGAAHVPGGFPLPAPADEQVPARLSQLLKADKAEPGAAAVTTPDADPLLKAVLAASGGVVLYDVPADPPATVYRTSDRTN